MLKKILFYTFEYLGVNRLYASLAKNRIFILGYHSVLPESQITDSLRHVCMPEEIFEEQIKYLLSHGHHFINFKDLENPSSQAKKTILYFDDGFQDNLTYILPILKKYDITATFFVVPRFLEEENNGYMGWQEVRRLAEEGMEIGSHTYSHAALDKLSQEEASRELESSKEKIEKEIGQKIIAFSYPKGRYNNQTPALVEQAGYKFAITTKYGTNRADLAMRPYLLKKVAPRVYESMAEFASRLYATNIFYDLRD